MTVYLGPQLVQLVNGYKYLRLLGVRISSTQSWQVAKSGGMNVNMSALVSEASITKSFSS